MTEEDKIYEQLEYVRGDGEKGNLIIMGDRKSVVGEKDWRVVEELN